MSDTFFGIDADALRAHAGGVAEVAAGVHQAAGAGATTLDGSAFGILCSPLALPVGIVCGTATAVIGHIAGQLDTLAADVRTMASTYDGSEAAASRAYSGAKRDYSTTLG